MLAAQDVSPKSGLATFILCICFGVFGFHRFYVGKIGTGLLMILTVGGLGFWVLYDMFSIVCKNFTDSHGRVVEIVKNKTAPRNIVIVMASIYILIAGSVVAIVGVSMHGVSSVGKDELAALRLGNIEEAYSYTSMDFQRGVSFDTFKKFVNSYPQLRNNVSSTFSDVEFKNNNGFISGALNMRNGTTEPVDLVLVNEYGQWRVNEINMNKADAKAVNAEQGQSADPQAAGPAVPDTTKTTSR